MKNWKGEIDHRSQKIRGRSTLRHGHHLCDCHRCKLDLFIAVAVHQSDGEFHFLIHHHRFVPGAVHRGIHVWGKRQDQGMDARRFHGNTLYPFRLPFSISRAGLIPVFRAAHLSWLLYPDGDDGWRTRGQSERRQPSGKLNHTKKACTRPRLTAWKSTGFFYTYTSVLTISLIAFRSYVRRLPSPHLMMTFPSSMASMKP